MARAFAEIAFTPTVQSIQKTFGSDQLHSSLLTNKAEPRNRITEREAEFIAKRDGFYQSTVSESGWPYVQFRGGPAGFIHILDEQRIAYADFSGNRQYLSVGNLTSNDRIAIIMMDYPNRRRLKLWGRVRIITTDEDPDFVARLLVDDYPAQPERAIVITVEAYDWNCPQHIPQRLTLDELDQYLAPIRAEIERLTAENKALKTASTTAIEIEAVGNLPPG